MAANHPPGPARWALRFFGRLFVPTHRFEPMFLFDGARRIRQEVDIPVICVGGLLSIEHIEAALRAGLEFVQIGRATIRDPDFVKKLASEEITESDCDQCNRCVAAPEPTLRT